MGLNPPFGVRGALANQFINHALKFKPKLLVFIVPKETERSVPNLLLPILFSLKGQSQYLNDCNLNSHLNHCVLIMRREQ